MTLRVTFWNDNGEYGWLSNYSQHEMNLDGKVWPSVEHYYQAQKHVGTPYVEEVRLQSTPDDARETGRARPYAVSNWQKIKEDIMYKAIHAKFTQHDDLREKLLATGDMELVEDSPVDYYWGIGKDGSGENRMGTLLMKLRNELSQK